MNTPRPLRAALAAIALALGLAGGAVAQQTRAAPAESFDHLATGFALTGAHTSTRCASCHVNGVFKGTPRDCASCHRQGGRLARGNTVMPSNHVPTALACESCHRPGVATWFGARFHANTAVVSGCASCHLGAYPSALARPNDATHATVTSACESCHRSTASFTSAVSFGHSAANAVGSGTCDGCHNGSGARGKPANHVPPPAGVRCDACHRSQTSWTPARAHANVSLTVNCAGCHSGAYAGATGKPPNATHAAVSGNCESCHTSNASWTSGVRFTHNAANAVGTGTCDSCHNGSSARGKPANHVPPPAGVRCDGCHRLQTSWTPARVHANLSIAGNCFSCHNGAFSGVTGKPATANHATVTGNCESCHTSTASWTSGIRFTHSAANAVGTGTCDTCHNGVAAKGKSSTHVPVLAGAARCDSCHRSQVSFTVSVTMNHTVVATAACKSCHIGTYVSQGLEAKPANHIPEVQLLGGATMDCNACHSSTTAWSTQRTNHNNSQGNGAGWCKGCHERSTAYLGSMKRMALSHYKNNTTATDCSMSGCHRPLGTKGTPYTKWD